MLEQKIHTLDRNQQEFDDDLVRYLEERHASLELRYWKHLDQHVRETDQTVDHLREALEDHVRQNANVSDRIEFLRDLEIEILHVFHLHNPPAAPQANSKKGTRNNKRRKKREIRINGMLAIEQHERSPWAPPLWQ